MIEKLENAIIKNDVKAVKTILSEHPHLASEFEDNVEPLLFFACSVGGLDVVKCLVDIGVEIEAKGPNGMTALSRAIDLDCYDIAMFLIQSGADVNSECHDGTPLCGALVSYICSADDACFEMLKELLKRKAVFKPGDGHLREGYLDNVTEYFASLVARRGWNRDIRYLWDKYFYSMCEISTVPQAAALGNIDDVKRLIKETQDPEDTLSYIGLGRNGLHIAVVHNDFEMAGYFLSLLKSNPNLTLLGMYDDDNLTPLDIAVSKEMRDLLRANGIETYEDMMECMSEGSPEILLMLVREQNKDT